MLLEEIKNSISLQTILRVLRGFLCCIVSRFDFLLFLGLSEAILLSLDRFLKRQSDDGNGISLGETRR